MYSVDSSDTKILKLYDRLTNAYSKLSQASSFVDPQIDELDDEYKEDFGQWRLISIDKVRLSFERLKSILSQHESFETTVDPRKGS